LFNIKHQREELNPPSNPFYVSHSL